MAISLIVWIGISHPAVPKKKICDTRFPAVRIAKNSAVKDKPTPIFAKAIFFHPFFVVKSNELVLLYQTASAVASPRYVIPLLFQNFFVFSK